jgi:hypothetical protein
MDETVATPEAAPAESPAVENDALAAFLAEDDTPQADTEGNGQSSEEEPANEVEAQEAEDGVNEESPPVDDLKYKVKVRGEEIEVPLNELLNGYSRTEDYKAKTAEVAELRRQAATEYADKLEQQVQLFASLDPILSAAQSIDMAQLAQEDPATYVQFEAQYKQRVQALQQAQAQIESVRQEQQARQQAELQSFYQQQRDALFAARPELQDQAKLQAFGTGVSEYLKGLGFSPDEITATNDHRALLVADKARLWDEYQKARSTAETKKVAPKQAPTLKPVASENSPRSSNRRPAPNAPDSVKQAWILSQLDAE